MKKTLIIFSFFFLANIGCTVSDPEMMELLVEINNQNKELLAEVKSLKSKSDSLINEIKSNSAKQEELIKKVNLLQGEIGKVLLDISKLSEDIKKQGVDIELIKSQLADLQKKYDQIIIQLEQLQQLSKILAEIENMKAQLKDLDAKYLVVINSLGQNQQALDALKSQVTLLQNQLAQNLTKISELTTLLGQQGIDIGKILAEIAELKKSTEDIKKSLEELLIINSLILEYSAGSVFGAVGPTVIVDVTNPKTGKTWMDRNLGASRAATSSTDAAAYGDLYQWGRRADGHQLRASTTTTTLSSSDQPGNSNFIVSSNEPSDWRNPQNGNLWQGVNGVNNPCPSGYRLPTETELNEERLSWNINTMAGAFASPLKWTVAGFRFYTSGLLLSVGSAGVYWSSTASGSKSDYLVIESSRTNMVAGFRSVGISVRCIKD
jgi:uncharacterized protein (TIGR02145 family)